MEVERENGASRLRPTCRCAAYFALALLECFDGMMINLAESFKMRVYSQVQINSGVRCLLPLIKLAEIFPRENTCLHLWVGGFMHVHISVSGWVCGICKHRS